MLATRYQDTGRDHWTLSKYESSAEKISQQRMSDSYTTSFVTQSEWQGHFGYPQPHGSVTLPPSLERTHDPPDLGYPRSAMEEERAKREAQVKEKEPPRPYSHAFQSTGVDNCTSNARRISEGHASIDSASEPPKASTHLDDRKSPLDTSHMVGESAEQWSDQCGPSASEDQNLMIKDEEDDGIDEEEDGGHMNHPQTAAERSAARRKMKRFRLTHQQTRFLMSEFVKQPHPDAAHRERLSAEIPGLSPRQVQVWFQNRRAKIKRMGAEDRDRVIKMRAVPEDFDNIQALHSPYGAVNGLGTPLTSPPQMNQPFGSHLNRSLMVDVRRTDANSNLSPTGLTPAFDGVGFPSPGVSSSEMMSSLSATSSDRYAYSSQLSSFGSGSRGSTTAFSGGQGRFDHSSQMGQQAMRPLHSLHLRDSLTRQRADSIQGPLRTGLPWKDEATDYAGYQHGSSNGSSTMPDRQQSMYQIGTSSNADSGSYDSAHYSGHSVQSPSGQDYSSLQPTSSARPRLRASSATFPLNLDLRNQYRPAAQTARSPGQQTANRAVTSSTQYTSPSIYTTSYPPAPLTAPLNVPQSRGTAARPDASDHPEHQMSAPNSSTGEFPGSAHGNRAMHTSAHTPMRDSFGGGPIAFGQDHERPGAYNEELNESGIHHRKSSYTGHGRAIGERTSSPEAHRFNHAS